MGTAPTETVNTGKDRGKETPKMEGRLWFDDSARNLGQKLKRAVLHYQDTLGEAPVRCFVNPKLIAGTDILGETIEGVEVLQDRNVNLCNFFFGFL